MLNDQYTSVFRKLTDWKKDGEDREGEILGDFSYTQNEVFNKLWKLKPKNSSGKNGVTNRMLKEGAPQLAWP